jgi:hypothetical protein
MSQKAEPCAIRSRLIEELLDEQLAELRAMRTGADHTALASSRPRRKMSAARRKAIAAAQRQRWAVLKGGAAEPREAPKKVKRKLSAAGRAAIVAALKKRWAAKRHRRKAKQSHGDRRDLPRRCLQVGIKVTSPYSVLRLVTCTDRNGDTDQLPTDMGWRAASRRWLNHPAATPCPSGW